MLEQPATPVTNGSRRQSILNVDTLAELDYQFRANTRKVSE
jgi:hypothetical protein